MNWFEPSLNDGDHVFVFGSNRQGRHGIGAAKTAEEHWGAVYGMGEGRQGQSYAIPTKDTPYVTLRLEEIKDHVDTFLAYARRHSQLRFLVTEIGCGHAGYSPEHIAPLFAKAPANCVLTPRFKAVLSRDEHAGVRQADPGHRRG